jgi:predicted nucleic acid-binding Zn ribbon protein
MLLDENNPPKQVLFDGRVFSLMGGKKRRYYLSRTKVDDKYIGLHVYIWQKHNGCTVPTGYEIHHKNSNTFDCSLLNLVCIDAKVHRRIPKNRCSEERSESLNRAQQAAKAWHKSPEGREWHRCHAYESIQKPGHVRPPLRPLGKFICVWCGDEFERRNVRKTLCSTRCQTALSKYRLGKTPTVHPNYRGE